MNTSTLLIGVYALYLIGPKIDIIPIEGSAIRISDLLVLIALGFTLHAQSAKLYISKTITIYYVFLLSQLVSYLINFELLKISGLLFIIRLFEYSIWFYVAQCLSISSKHIDFRNFSSRLILLLAIWSFLEWFELVPKFGKFTNVSSRVSVNTSGPFEFAALIAMLIMVSNQNISRMLGSISLLLTQSRITIFAFLVNSVWAFRNKIFLYIVALSTITILALFQISDMSDVTSQLSGSRFSLLFYNDEAFNLASNFFSNAPTISSSQEYFDLTHVGSGVKFGTLTDVSLEMRLIRWSIVISTVFSSVSSALFGLGPSFWGVALDGNYIRIVGEQGILGLVIFIVFLVSTHSEHRRSTIFKSFLIILSITALFVDIFVTDKVMSLFWFVHGILFGQQYLKSRGTQYDKGVFLREK